MWNKYSLNNTKGISLMCKKRVAVHIKSNLLQRIVLLTTRTLLLYTINTNLKLYTKHIKSLTLHLAWPWFGSDLEAN